MINCLFANSLYLLKHQSQSLNLASALAELRDMLSFLLIITPAIASALTGIPEERVVLNLQDQPESTVSELILSPELISDTANTGNSEDLTAGLLGTSGTTADEVIKTLSPHLQSCQLELILAQAAASERVVHERYRLRCGGYSVDDSLLTLHHLDHRLSMVRARLPSLQLPQDPITDLDFRPLADLGVLDASSLSQAITEKVLANKDGIARPAWRVVNHDASSGKTKLWVFDAQTGDILRADTTAFDMVNVYERSPRDGELIRVELQDLSSTGFLDGRYFRIFAPDETVPRVLTPFQFRPDDPDVSLAFDQVQVYYSAMRVLQWLEMRFGYDSNKVTQMPVRINQIVNGKSDNAQYIPPPKGPEILIGPGGSMLTQLARDSDVFTHEFMHHVIYEFVSSHRDESGIFHEGTADYFAYALNGDPNLAESTVLAGGPLRTALLDDSARFDSFAIGQSPHRRGQVWSAMLWELRVQIGETFDRTVYDSLPYLGPSSGFRDAIVALIHADQALTGGIDRCRILEVAVRRGFGLVLGELDGAVCGLDLHELARESQERLKHHQAAPNEDKATWEDGVRKQICGVVRTSNPTDRHSSWFVVLILLTSSLPWAWAWISKKS